MSKITIIGSGMAGLLAGNMLRDYNPRLLEAAKSLPNNHSAVLRFRSSIVGDVLRIPFKKVKVAKGNVHWRNPIADSMAYSKKTNGVYRSDRSIVSVTNELSERYIAPPDLINLMGDRVKIDFNEKFKKRKNHDSPIISTIPMPLLMEILEYKDFPEFKFIHGFNISVDLHDTEAYLSIYVPNPSLYFNRVSVTGNKLIMEYSFPHLSFDEVRILVNKFKEPKMRDTQLSLALEMIGMNKDIDHAEFASEPEIKLQTYSKILPIDEDERKHFISWATDKHNVYSLGRYACWRPGLLLDDLVNDIRLIEHWITRKDNYSRNKHNNRRT